MEPADKGLVDRASHFRQLDTTLQKVVVAIRAEANWQGLTGTPEAEAYSESLNRIAETLEE